MPDDELLDELLDRWEELVEQQEHVDLAELCRDAPHLLSELSKRVQMLSAVDSLLSIYVSHFNSPSQNGSSASPSDEDIAAAISLINAGRYVPVRFLAEGGLGRLYVARDTELNRDVVLKLIKNERLVDDETRRRFEFEAQITCQLDHPGIVPVFGFGLDERSNGRQFPYYAMRLIRGKRLEDAIQEFHSASMSQSEHNLELQRLLRCFLTVCETIAYAHSRGIIHRDLKPANIMLGEYGETLVVDWGLAKIIGSADDVMESWSSAIRPEMLDSISETRAGDMKGTLAYMSSEQAQGKWDKVNSASDIYSLGAILYTLLTGQRAFPGRDDYVIYRNVLAGRFASPRQVSWQVPQALEKICLKAMQLEPTRRYATATELANDIEHWLADEPVTAWREPWYYRLRRWCKRHATALVSTGAAMLVAIVGLTSAAYLLEEKNQQLQTANNLAEASFQQANQAVRDIVDQACGNSLFRRPGMHPAQESLLRVALEYYRQFIRQRADDPKLQKEMLQARLVVANIVHDLRSPLEARQEYQSLGEFLEPLLIARPQDQQLRQAEALVNSRQSQIDCELGQFDENQKHFARADATYQDLLRAAPDNFSLCLAYANAIYLQGEETGDLSLLDRATQLARSSVDQAGAEKDQALVLLSRINNQMGLLQMREARLEQAAKSLEQAQSLMTRFHDDSTPADSPDLHAIRAGIALNLGRLAKLQGHPERAMAYLAEAKQGFEGLVRRDPEIGFYRVRLATTCVELGKLSLASGQNEQAHQELSTARDQLNAQPNTALRLLDRYELARCLLDLGEATIRTADGAQAKELILQSQREFQALITINAGNPDYHRNLAATWNQLAAISQRDGDVDGCLTNLQNAVKETEPIATAHPNRPEFKNALAKIYFNLAMVCSSQSDWDDAWQWFGKSRVIFDQEVADHPEIAEYRSDRSQFLTKFIDICQLRRRSDATAQTDPGLLKQSIEALEALQKTSPLSSTQEELLTTLRNELNRLSTDKPSTAP